MLGVSSHAWKVNFCKFTNETRNGIEDSSKHSGLKFLAAVNGACAGGGYELALACDEIVLVDDRSSSVSLPEVPLLGVLPGTGGLTRVTDKRHVRHDLADIFCTSVEGVRGQRAVDWRLVDDDRQAGAVRAPRCRSARSSWPQAATARPTRKGVALTPPRARGRAPTACATSTSRSRSTAPAAPPPSPSRRPPARSPPTSPRSKPPAPPGGRSRWRASSTTPSCNCAPTSSTSAPGCSRPKATPQAVLASDATHARQQGPLARARDHRRCCAARWRASTCRRAACSR